MDKVYFAIDNFYISLENFNKLEPKLFLIKTLEYLDSVANTYNPFAKKSNFLTTLIRGGFDVELLKTWPPGYTFSFSVGGYINLIKDGLLLASGTPSYVKQCISNKLFVTDKLKSLLEKHVRFYYNGGTSVGHRVIKLNKYDDYKLYGIDLVKNEYREYLRNKITGEVAELKLS